MKKILCLIDGLGQGGAERQIVGLAHLLKEKGFDVTLLSYHAKNFYKDMIAGYGIDHVYLEGLNSSWKKFRKIGAFIKSGGYDCVIAYKNGTCLLASLIKRFGGKFRLIVSERNLTRKLTIRERFKFRSYRYADWVVANSLTQKEFICNRFPRLSGKTVCITNFTDTKYFCPGDSPSESTFKILVAARFAPQKNQLLFLEAVKLLKDKGLCSDKSGRKLHVRWLGDISAGQTSYKEDCLERLKELHLEEVFSFHPASNDILREYRKCDVFCLPSSYEGFPNVICEAMSCGKPVICSRVCDNPSIVEDNVSGLLFDPSSAESMAEAMERVMLMGREKLEMMGKEGRRIALERFSEDTFVDSYIKLID